MKTLLSIFLLFAGFTAFGQQTNIVFSAQNNNQTFNTCNGFIIDSGGQGGSGYGNGENTVITICPGTPGDIISIVFNLFQLSTTDDNPAPNITNVDYMDVYDGASTAAPTLGTYTGNQLQGVVINATALNPSGCITLRFRSNTVGTGMFSASATCETPCSSPVAGGIIVAGETSDSTRVCVGEPVNFANMGSFAQPGFTITNYQWDFMDGSTANGANVSHTFSVPGQYLVELFVTDDNNCGNTNLIDLQVFVATIPDFTGFPGDTTLCIGESVQFTADPESYEVIWDGFNGSQSISDGCLPDTLLGVSQDIQIMQTGFTPGATLTQLSDIDGLCLDLEHSFMGDLVIIVQCPNGQSQILHQQGGGGTQIGEPNPLDNVDCSDPTTQGVPYTYCFTPVATDTWVEWATASGFGTIPAGDYEPIEPFTNLLGCPLNGIWTLTVIDNWAADDGTLFTFDINLDASLYPPVTVFEPQIGHGADSSFWSMPANFATVSSNGDVLTIVPTSPGTNTYIYNVIDNYGCQHDTSVTVTVNANPVADAGPDVTICNGTPVELAGSIIGGNINCNYTINLDDSFGDGWNGNNLLVTINGVTTSYTIPTGSAATFNIPVTNGQTISFQFDGAGSFLGECSYEILDAAGNVVFTDGGNFNSPSTAVQQLIANCLGNLTYAWTPAGILSNPAINNPIVTTGTNTTLTFTVYPTGHPLCATSDQVNVNISASANPGTNNTLSICSQGTPTDLFPLLGPNASVLGTWSNPVGAAVNMPYDPVTMNPGIYTYSVDSNGCISQATITVAEVSPTINIVPTNINCHGSSNGSAVVTTANATTYSLDGGAQQPIPSSPFSLNGLTLGSHTVDIFGIGGCNNTMTFNITEPPALSITNISPDEVLCPGESTTVQATGAGGSTAYTYTWTMNNAVLGTGTPFAINNVTQTADYCVVLTEACGSTPATACMTIMVPQPLNLVLTPDDPDGCYPHTVQFTNNSTGAGNVVGSTINFGDGTPEVTTVGLASFTHQFAEPGVYTVSITSVSDSGCVYSQTFTNMIMVYDDPVAGFILTPNPTTFFQTHVNLLNSSSSDVVSYSWSMPGGTPNQSVSQNTAVDYPEGEIGTYPVTLTVTNAAGCIDTLTQFVQVLSEVILYAPNTFTPDGDEFNQNWFLYIEGIDVTQFNLKVFNRWGEVVWENNDPQGSWDGTYGGRIVQDGTYNWILETKDQISDKKYTFNGHITITK